MKNTTWFMVGSGDVVQFRYVGKNGISENRTVICLDPRYKYKKKSTNRNVEFFIGLQIDTKGKGGLTPASLKTLLQILGKVESDLESGIFNDTQRIRKIYDKLESFLKTEPIFRTYLLRECRRRRVFLMDKYSDLNKQQIKQVSEKLMEEKETQATLEVEE